MQAGQKHIGDLDALRGLAIILVVAFHSQEFLVPGFALYSAPPQGFIWTPRDVGWARFLWNISPSAIGWAGVDLFLLLSGFLIHWSTLNRASLFGWAEFYQRRFWRIYPAYLAVLVVFILILGPFPLKDVVTHFLLIHNYDPDTFYSINGSLWSLALEVQMYLLYPFLLKLNGSKGFIRSIVIIGLISIAGLAANMLYGPWGPAFNSSLVRLWIIWVVGAWMAERHHQGLPIFRRHQLLLLLLIAVIPVLNISVLRPYMLRYGLLLFFAVMLEMILLYGIMTRPVKGSSRLISACSAGAVFLGTCSYSMYLIHQPILRWSIRVWNEWGLMGGQWFGMVPILLVIIAGSHLLYTYLELPSMRIGRHLTRSSSKST